MPTYSGLQFYDVDPRSIFSNATGGTAVYTGPGSADGTLTIFDTGSGVDGLELTDDNRGEGGTTADATIGGNTSTGVNADAEWGWTVRDSVTGEVFNVVQLEIEGGPAAGNYTLSEKPLVAGRTYETLNSDSLPENGDGTVFTYANFVSEDDLTDGIVSGTANDDLIDGAYSGDDDGDVVDGGDAPGVSAASLSLNWTAEGGDGQDISGGFTQDTGGIEVAVTFDQSPTTDTIAVETGTQFVGTGEPFDSNSSAYLFGTHSGSDTVTTTLDFSAVAGSGYADAVENVQFRANDIDEGGWQDIVTVRAFDPEGNPVTVNVDLSGNTSDTVSGDTVTGGGGVNNTAGQNDGSALFTIAGPVSSVEIEYDNGGTAGQGLNITDVHFDTIPTGADDDSIEAGEGQDTVLAGLGDDTVIGGAGNDSLSGEEGDDTLYGDDQPPGDDWQYAFYNKDFTSADGQAFDIEDGTLAEEGYTDDFDVEGLAQQVRGSGNNPEDFGVIYTSTLTAADTGTHRFDTTSDDGSTIRILDSDGNPVTFTNQDGTTGPFMDNDQHQAPTTRWGDVDLTAGETYTIEIRYWENGGGQVLSSDVTTPDGTTTNLLNSPLISGPPAVPGGDDTLTGGAGADLMDGAGGDDILNIGGGDTALGGGGDDTFVIDAAALTGGGTVSVDGGEEDETAGDTLDLSGFVTANNISYTNTDPGPGGMSGTATLNDGTIVSFSNIEDVVICFTAGTRILTPRGQRPVEDLAPGDAVVTRDNGVQAVRWAGRRRVAGTGRFAPVRINARTTGNDRALLVSPQHRMLHCSAVATLYFDSPEVLIPAKHLINGSSIVQEETESIEYVHLLFDRHEIIFAEGCPSESFHPGQIGLSAVAGPAREELFQLFPDLRSNPNGYGQTARQCLRAHEARALQSA